jgi:hypothetical protein
LGIICGCVPSLKPLVARIVPRIIRNASETSELDYRGSIACHSSRSPPVVSSADPIIRASTGNAQDIILETRDTAAVHGISMSSVAISEAHHSTAEGIARRTARQSPSSPFITLIHPKSMPRMTWEESFIPITIMCIIFFLWGFAYGFIDVLDAQFRQAAGRPLQTSFQLHAAYFGAYLFGPFFVARPILNRRGFNTTLLTGLLIYSCGTLAFWPAAVLISLPGFVISNFMVGLGVSVVETAADLFMVLCGPMEYAEMRLSFAQGVQAVGGVASPLLAQEVLFGDVTTPTALISVQWTYLAISIIAILVAVAYNLIQLPEASSDELKLLAERRQQDYSDTVCGMRVVWVTLWLGVLCQFCNIGAQENLQTKFRTFVLYNEPR